ncbi:serine hydrolase [Mucilaginibacter terrae]|uniref:serine hydrolase n=1 Tax=Mucilaginibacter terrae TaxID=1955052 RepID=UPI003638111A
MVILTKTGFAQPQTNQWLAEMLQANASLFLKDILDRPDIYQVQIIYTRIDRDKKGEPHFTSFNYNVDAARYFYPASTVKLPTVALALEKLNKLHIAELDKNTGMLTDSGHKGQTAIHTDTSAQNKLPSVAHYLKKVFLVSDNDAYSRLFEFVGQQTLNERLQNMGYTNTLIPRRFFVMPDEDHRYTNPIKFINDRKTVYEQPVAYSTFKFDFTKDHYIPRVIANSKGQLIADTLNLATHNTFPLKDQQQILQAILFPKSVSKKMRFDLKKDDYALLYEYMSMLPAQSKSPEYNAKTYFDTYGKFFSYRADKHSIPPYIYYYNKAGWAYNFLTDNAYIVDTRNHVEYMLSAVINLNRDTATGDRYEKTGYPFFKEIGDIIYKHELQRTHPYKPVLTKLIP